jgi:hypothetical protein
VIHTSIFNRINNTMNPNINVTQSKVFLDPLLVDYWRRRYFYTLNFFSRPVKHVLGAIRDALTPSNPKYLTFDFFIQNTLKL